MPLDHRVLAGCILWPRRHRAASSGAEALKAIDERCPNLVLAAHPLPGVGGTEITAIIKARAGPKPLRTQMRKSLMTGVNEQRILTN